MSLQRVTSGKTSVRERVSSAEWATRIELAACYRLVALFGWSDIIYNHISARVPGEDEAYLLNAYGLAYEEITASSLIKVDVEGNVLLSPNEDYSINRTGFVIHGAIHAARPDLTCIIHTHTIAGMAISTMKCGLLPLTQSIMRFPHIAYHDYEGISVDSDECARLVRDLGDAEVMVLRNHGLLAAGASIGQAFNNIYRLERASQVQLQAMGTQTELVIPTPEVFAHTVEQFAQNPASARNGRSSPMGLLEWPALRRMLDRRDTSYRD